MSHTGLQSMTPWILHFFASFSCRKGRSKLVFQLDPLISFSLRKTRNSGILGCSLDDIPQPLAWQLPCCQFEAAPQTLRLTQWSRDGSSLKRKGEGASESWWAANRIESHFHVSSFLHLELCQDRPLYGSTPMGRKPPGLGQASDYFFFFNENSL